MKHNFLVKDVRDIAATIKKAFTLPVPADPGRCWSTSPDVSNTACLRVSPNHRDALLQSGHQGSPGQIKKALQLLLDAKRPMIYSGGGVVLGNAAEKLTSS